MGKPFCLVSLTRRNKTSRSKVMREDVCSQATRVASEKDAQLNNSVKKLEGDILKNSTVMLQQNIKMKFVNFCTVGNGRKELVSSYGSENESSSRELEFADFEHERELGCSDSKNHRFVLDDILTPFIKAAAPDFTFSQGPTEQDTSIESVTDNECLRVSSGAGFSESPVIPSADNVNDTALSGDKVPTWHTSDSESFQTDMPACNSSSKHKKFSPEVEFKSSLAEASRLDYKDHRPQSHSRISEQLPSVAKMTYNANVQEIFQSRYKSAGSNLTFATNNMVVRKPEESMKLQLVTRRKPWWKIFLFSHRNIQKKGSHLHDSEMDDKVVNPFVGYTSDVRDANGGQISDSAGSALDVIPTSAPRNQAKTSSESSNDFDRHEHGSSECKNGLSREDIGTEHYCSGRVAMSEKGFFVEPVIVWPSEESVAVSKKASFKRVEDWINNIEPTIPPKEAFEDERGSVGPNNILKTGLYRNSVGGENPGQTSGTYSEIANAVAISLNALSTMAVFSGFGLKVVPSLGTFSSLKTLNLSGNCIERIIPGSLPRNLQSLDLSRNRIALVEGLRGLTRLRVINLSYNRISRIGHGLANCTLTKELHLSDNNISDVEGLHRLSKLSVLDLGFNKLTTPKSLGHLAANYSSLLVLNLLGNPVHANLGEEQLRRLVITLVPHLNFLNRQPVKAISAREAVMDSVARAAMGSSHRTSNSRRARKLGRTSVQKSRLPAHDAKTVARAHGNSGVSEFLRAQHHASAIQQLEKGFDREKQQRESLSPCSADEWLTQPINQAREESIPRSRS